MKSKAASNARDDIPSVPYVILVVSIACVTAITHRNHLANMYERDRHFSHLSTLERELGFRTEMGLYYSYFKTVVESVSISDGLQAIMHDNVTEFPTVINTLKRFNLYPEVMLGISYRAYISLLDMLGIPSRRCWKVSRGHGLPSILSCEGLGEPPFFYIEAVFLLNGISLGVLFVLATYLSESILGGMLTVASFFYNHGECTRVQWTPPLRESFAYPFFVIQIFLVTHTIRSCRPSYIHSVFIALATICFMLPWQFAQFALLTQCLSMFAVYLLKFTGQHTVRVIITGQIVGSAVSTVLLFGNTMLLSSYFVSCVFSIWLILSLENLLNKMMRNVFLLTGCQVGLLCVGTLGIKKLTALILNVADDAHISDILRSKFTSFRSFHTLLYTCAAEFDFMQFETPIRVTKTLLAPAVLLVLATLAFQMWKTSGHNTTLTPQHKHKILVFSSKPFAELLYNIFQLMFFTILAVLIMRLKLFWTPHLCLVTSMLASRKLFGWVGDMRRHYSLLLVLLGLMSVQGSMNLQWQWNIMGEYENYPTEQLMDWINGHTSTDAAFAGPMSLMANIKLSTKRPIANHPHYEDAQLRARTLKIYSLFSRKPEIDVYNNLREFNVTYAVLEQAWCVGRSRLGCSMVEIWDVEDPQNSAHEPTCQRLVNHPEPLFRRVYRNEQYDVLQLAAAAPA